MQDGCLEREQLFERYIPLAYGMAVNYAKVGNRWYDLDDLKQESLIGLYIGTQKYNKELSANGSAKTILMLYIRSYLNEWDNKQKRHRQGRIVFNDSTVGCEIIIRDPIQVQSLAEIIEVSTLTRKQKEVLYFKYSKGLGLTEIGKIYGVSPQRIDQIEKDALRKLRRELKHESYK